MGPGGISVDEKKSKLLSPLLVTILEDHTGPKLRLLIFFDSCRGILKHSNTTEKKKNQGSFLP
jgi:hypothetical protein